MENLNTEESFKEQVTVKEQNTTFNGLKENGCVLAIWLLISSLVAYAFFESVVAFLILQIFFIPFRKKLLHMIKKRKMEKLKLQFKDMLKSMTNALENGYSLENSIRESRVSMVALYGKDEIIVKEIDLILNRIKLNISAVDALFEWSKRSGIPEVSLYGSTLGVIKETGGDIARITKDLAEMIEMQHEDGKRIEELTASKRYEQLILSAVPIVMIFYIKFTSKGYMDALYEGITGRVCMGICLFIYVFSICMSIKILNIDS